MISVAPQQRAFVVWWHDLERWMVPASTLMAKRLPKGWVLTKLANLSKQIQDRTEVQPDLQYKMAGVKWYGEGVFHRETVRGNEMSANYVTPLKAGAFIYNRLFAWKASFAVVPAELADCYVSSEFPQFVVDETRLLPKYLHLYCISSATVRTIRAASTGTAAVSRNRFREEFFLDLEMPLPPISIQRTVVDKWEKAKAEIAELNQQIAKNETAIERTFLADLGLEVPKKRSLPKAFALWWRDLQPRWGVDVNRQVMEQLDPAAGKYQVTKLSDVIADLENGWSPKCLDRPADNNEWGVLKLGAVSFGVYNELENKTLPTAKAAPRQELEIQAGDLLISRANITRLVGACALVHQTRPRLMLCDKIFRALWHSPSPIDKSYLSEILKIQHVRQQIENNVTGTSATMKNITKPALLGLRFPLPPLGVQQVLANKINFQRKEIETMKAAVVHKTRQAESDVAAMILGEAKIVS